MGIAGVAYAVPALLAHPSTLAVVLVSGHSILGASFLLAFSVVYVVLGSVLFAYRWRDFGTILRRTARTIRTAAGR